MPTISACIVAYCDYEEVCAAVRSILHFTPAPDFTLYIVDNASPDGCGKQLADTDWADPRVQVLCLPENVGFGRGHNAVLGKLHSSVHFILNPDIVLTGDILQPMAEWPWPPHSCTTPTAACSTCPGASPRLGCCWPASWHQSSVERSKKLTTTTPCRTRI